MSKETRAEAKVKAERLVVRLLALLDDRNAPRPADVPESLDAALLTVVKLSEGVAPESESAFGPTGDTKEFFDGLRAQAEARNAKGTPTGPPVEQRLNMNVR